VQEGNCPSRTEKGIDAKVTDRRNPASGFCEGVVTMEFEVYCDESMPDLFTSKKPGNRRYLMIGSLWLPASLRDEIKEKIGELREKYNTWGEIKWTKISHPRADFYLALIDLFISYKYDLRFRCIAVDHSQVNMSLLDNDEELGFYKFYYQLLHHWILDFNAYRILCDVKTNRDPKRLQVLRRCLQYANLSSKIEDIQSLPSSKVALIQLCDLLLGAASSRMNKTLKEGSAKEQVLQSLEHHLNIAALAPTSRNEQKFNIFRIHLEGGW
jgi:acyl-CoA-binding protein